MVRGSAAIAALIAIPVALVQSGCLGRQANGGSGGGASQVGDATADQLEGGTADQIEARLEARLEAEFRPLIDAHNARVAKLDALEAKGVVEVWFRDGGEHKREQLDVDLLLAPGGRGSLRLRKLSTDFACVGGDGRRAWIFDLRAKPASATVFEALPTEVEAGAARALATGEIEVLSPASLRFMMGLTAIPDDARVVESPRDAGEAQVETQVEKQVGTDAERMVATRSRYCVSWTRSSVTTRISFGADGLPQTLRLERPDGAVIATSRLSAYEPARVEGLSQLAWPMVATRFRADAPAADAWAQFKIESPEAQVRRGKPRMFDLDALIGHYRPESVDYILREEGGSAPSARERETP